MRKLEEQAEGLVHAFNSQGVANTLWAYATLGMQPGEGLMRKLEEQAEGVAHTFNLAGCCQHAVGNMFL